MTTWRGVAKQRTVAAMAENASRLNNFPAQQKTYPRRFRRAYIPHVLLNEGAI
jgi:hypothetical protein